MRFLSFGQEQYKGRVSKILPSADSATQRYTVFLDVFVPPDRALVPGLTGEVSIIITQHTNAIIIPRRALVGQDPGRVARRRARARRRSLRA